MHRRKHPLTFSCACLPGLGETIALSKKMVVSLAMKSRLVLSLILLSQLGLVGGVWAQAPWRDLPVEDRRQMRQQMREHWQQERELRREAAPPWRDLPPEDRRRLRDEMREQRREQHGWPESGHPPGHGGGWRRN